MAKTSTDFMRQVSSVCRLGWLEDTPGGGMDGGSPGQIRWQDGRNSQARLDGKNQAKEDISENLQKQEYQRVNQRRRIFRHVSKYRNLKEFWKIQRRRSAVDSLGWAARSVRKLNHVSSNTDVPSRVSLLRPRMKQPEKLATAVRTAAGKTIRSSQGSYSMRTEGNLSTFQKVREDPKYSLEFRREPNHISEIRRDPEQS